MYPVFPHKMEFLTITLMLSYIQDEISHDISKESCQALDLRHFQLCVGWKSILVLDTRSLLYGSVRICQTIVAFLKKDSCAGINQKLFATKLKGLSLHIIEEKESQTV